MVEFDAHFRTIYYTTLFVLLYLVPMLLIVVTSLAIARVLMCSKVFDTQPHNLNLTRQSTYRQRDIHRHKVITLIVALDCFAMMTLLSMLKIGKMILVLAASFLVSWTPYFAITIITQYQEENFMQRSNYFFTMLCINLSAFLNSAINPIIYGIMSARFRHSFRLLAKRVVCKDNKVNNVIAFNERSFTNSKS